MAKKRFGIGLKSLVLCLFSLLLAIDSTISCNGSDGDPEAKALGTAAFHVLSPSGVWEKAGEVEIYEGFISGPIPAVRDVTLEAVPAEPIGLPSPAVGDLLLSDEFVWTDRSDGTGDSFDPSRPAAGDWYAKYRYGTLCLLKAVLENGDVKSIPIAKGTPLLAAKNPEVEFYDFAGWYDDQDLINRIVDSFRIMGDMRLYVKHLVNQDAPWLTFTACDADLNVKLAKVNLPDGISLEYSTGSLKWTDYSAGDGIPMGAEGGKVFLRAKEENGSLSKDENNYYRFEISGGGPDSRVEVSGNVMSLLKADCSRGSVPKYCFCKLFENCTSLVSAPDLPAETLADHCYYGMFEGCASLASAPELPALTLAEFCYAFMFSDCSSLISTPQLPAETLAGSCYFFMFANCTSLVNAADLNAENLKEECYEFMFKSCNLLTNASKIGASALAEKCCSGMFDDCESLEKAPDLMVESLVKDCYYQMFVNCKKLSYIRVGFSSWGGEFDTFQWMYDVGSAASGTKEFHCPSSLPEENGVSRIPNDWIVCRDV